MNPQDQEKLMERLVAQISDLLTDEANSNMDGALYEVQPPSKIVLLAAKAAAIVLVTFEIVYRMIPSEEQQA